LPFAATVAVSNLPLIPNRQEGIPGPPAIIEPAVEIRDAPAIPASPPADIVAPSLHAESGTFDRPSLVARLNAPTRWRRSTGLKIWTGLSVVLVLLVGKLIFSRARAGSTRASHSTAQAALLPSPAADTATADPPEERPSLEQQPESPAPASAPPSSNDVSSNELAERGLGYVTVHSPDPRASVYLMLTRYGLVEEKLPVPCGKRFIGIGFPVAGKKEPTWLAPGKKIEVPCGGAIELTINPRMLK
jgi:hypothetical protein